VSAAIDPAAIDPGLWVWHWIWHLYDPGLFEQRQRQRRTLRRLLDGIVWDWDNPYLDPGDWRPLEEDQK
jgi:hypothetical protein